MLGVYQLYDRNILSEVDVSVFAERIAERHRSNSPSDSLANVTHSGRRFYANQPCFGKFENKESCYEGATGASESVHITSFIPILFLKRAW